MTAQLDLPAALNTLAGVSGFDAQGAANAWAGTTGYDLVGALNAKAGTTNLDLNGVCTKLLHATASFSSLPLGFDAQGALSLMAGKPAGTALTLYVSGARTGNAAVLTTSPSTGTLLTFQSRTHLPGSPTRWWEITLGSLTGTVVTAEPTPSGKGAVFPGSVLTGKKLVAGKWSGSLQIRTQTTVTMSALKLRFWRDNSGTYHQIGTDIALSTITITGSFHVYNWTATVIASTTFATGTELYVDLVGQGGTSSATEIFVSEGLTHFSIITPGYA